MLLPTLPHTWNKTAFEKVAAHWFEQHRILCHQFPNCEKPRFWVQTFFASACNKSVPLISKSPKLRSREARSVETTINGRFQALEGCASNLRIVPYSLITHMRNLQMTCAIGFLRRFSMSSNELRKITLILKWVAQSPDGNCLISAQSLQPLQAEHFKTFRWIEFQQMTCAK